MVPDLIAKDTGARRDGERSLLLVAAPQDGGLVLSAFAQERIPFEIVAARDGDEALEYLLGTGRHAGRDKLISPLMTVIDLTVPALGGKELLGRIRADRLLRHLVAVLLTADEEESARLKYTSVGCDLFAVKPKDLSGYLAMARQMKVLLSHHG